MWEKSQNMNPHRDKGPGQEIDLAGGLLVQGGDLGQEIDIRDAMIGTGMTEGIGLGLGIGTTEDAGLGLTQEIDIEDNFF